MLEFRKEPAVSVTLMQLFMNSHTDENLSMSNFRPESLPNMHFCMGSTCRTARHFSLQLSHIFIFSAFPDKAISYLEECDGKSVVPCNICITKDSVRFLVFSHVFVTILVIPVFWVDFFYFLQTKH